MVLLCSKHMTEVAARWTSDRELPAFVAELLQYPAHLLCDLPTPCTLELRREGVPIWLFCKPGSPRPGESKSATLKFANTEVEHIFNAVDYERLDARDFAVLLRKRYRDPTWRLGVHDAFGFTPQPHSWQYQSRKRLGEALEVLSLELVQAYL
jgi:hypothetical protein